MKAFIFCLALSVAVEAKSFSNRPEFLTGKQFEENRITGGSEVTPNSIPWQVALMIQVGERTVYCGGSLISRNFVLTAAHCLLEASEVTVILGAHNFFDEGEPNQIRLKTKSFLIYEDFTPKQKTGDIALIQLPTPIEFSEAIQAIELPKRSQTQRELEGLPAIQSGWGKTSDEASGASEKLHSVETTILSNEYCNEYYVGIIKDSLICSDGAGGKSTCFGDSGGPLTVDGVLQGIVSFGVILGCEAGWPAAFTRVSSYLNWIEDHSDVFIK